MGEDRDPRLLLHPRHEAFAAAGHDHVDIAVETREHRADRRAVAGRNEADRVGRETRLSQPLAHRRRDGARGSETIRAGAENGGISRLETQRARIGRNIRAAFEDDPDDAERRCDPLDHQTVRPLETRQYPPNRIGQRRDAVDRPCDIFDPAFIKGKSIDKRRREAIVTRLRHVLGIRLQDLGCARADRRRHGGERRVLLVGARQSESVGGPSSPAPQIHHLGPNLVGNARYRGFGVESP